MCRARHWPCEHKCRLCTANVILQKHHFWTTVCPPSPQAVAEGPCNSLGWRADCCPILVFFTHTNPGLPAYIYIYMYMYINVYIYIS